jgi:hypothetical protein
MMVEDLLGDLGCEVAGSFGAVGDALAWLGGDPASARRRGAGRQYRRRDGLPGRRGLRARGVPFVFATGYGDLPRARASRTSGAEQADQYRPAGPGGRTVRPDGLKILPLKGEVARRAGGGSPFCSWHPLSVALGRHLSHGERILRTRLLSLTRRLAELVGRKRSGRDEPGDRDDVLRFGSTCPLRRNCSCVRIGPSERVSALIPKSPRTGANQGRSANPSRPPTIGDRRVYDPSPCRSTLSHGRGFRWSRIYPRTDHHRPCPRDRAAPLSSIPIAASGRIQAPSPCDGDTKSMQQV